MRLYIPIIRQQRRDAEAALRESCGGTPHLEGHTWEVGQVASIREARDILAQRMPIAWPLHGAALLDDATTSSE